jgi:hypothetical protein
MVTVASVSGVEHCAWRSTQWPVSDRAGATGGARQCPTGVPPSGMDMDVVAGVVISVAVVWAFVRMTVRDPEAGSHSGSPGGHVDGGDGGGGC